MAHLKQTPNLGEHKLFFRGDIIEFKLELDNPLKGKAFLRTNLGNAAIRRREVIAKILEKRMGSSQDWCDIPMQRLDDRSYSVSIALLEVGHFEAICYFYLDDTEELLWAGSENVSINVEPTEYSCANSIYCAFLRQYGPNKNYSVSRPIMDFTEEEMSTYDKNGFTIIPPSGTFRSFIKELDFIIYGLNCRIIHLLPITPTPTLYGKMGRYGSPYASLDLTNIDPSLAEFDTKATPLEQFLELVDEIHHRNAKVIIDVAINHVGWAAKIHEEHPEWLVRKEDGTIVSPGVWGNIWADLTELDHRHVELKGYLAEMFITWAERGVDGFRCDAGYMVPFESWEYIICKVRDSYPDIIFLLEGLGGDVKITQNLLNRCNMNWAYSELFQNYSKEQIENYIKFAHSVSSKDGIMVHYAETHDNNRLAAISEIYSKMRTGLSALLSSNGAFGITNGVEWFAAEKIDVHEARALNWDNKNNQIQYISRLNKILITHPAFHKNSNIDFINTPYPNVIALSRSDSSTNKKLLILINLDCEHNTDVELTSSALNQFKNIPAYDLITERDFTPNIKGRNFSIKLERGQALCISPNMKDLEKIIEAENENIIRPDVIDVQRAKAMALDVICWQNRSCIIDTIKIENIEQKLLNDPTDFLKSLYLQDYPIPVIHWNWPEDVKRKVLVPYEHILMVTALHRFRCVIVKEKTILIQKDSIRSNSGKYFAILLITPINENFHVTLKIKMSVYGNEKCERKNGELLLLPPDISNISLVLNSEQIRQRDGIFLTGNQRGGMLRQSLMWGTIKDRYNCLLGANLDIAKPVDRQIMFNRTRAWLVKHGRSIELNINTIKNFILNSDAGGTWTFHIPVENGFYVDISITLIMIREKNAISMHLYRHFSSGDASYLPDDNLVSLVLRPDVEDRNFYQDTKVTSDIRNKWEAAVKGNGKGFTFSPYGERILRVMSTTGIFYVEPEWQYMIYRKTEAERGFDPNSDLFSPGYFKINFTGGESSEVIAQVLTSSENKEIKPFHDPNFKFVISSLEDSFEHIMLKSIRKFVVNRDGLKTIIAGYPWFLDWGRDALICARGLISAEMYDDVEKILLQFAQFSKDGMLPNIISGNDVGNWNTSDAPLWLIKSSEDYYKVTGGSKFLNANLGDGRTFIDVIISIVNCYINGTKNGIKMDETSGLIFSPSHFTWMDTNYPAGTPREGYPIEIQALWFAALKFLSVIDKNPRWKELLCKVQNSIMTYFVYEEKNENNKSTGIKWLSDCLHCSPMKPASEAVRDDYLRCNQLLAITLGVITDKEIKKSILDAASTLLVPGAIRTLADRKTEYKLPIYAQDGHLLNNPIKPYFGHYEGPEDTKRKPAYHNGTAWTWLFPSYSEAYYKVYGEEGKSHAKSILSSARVLIEEGSFGDVPEIVDGDFPHKQRGCDAQAWGVTELYRVWKLLHN